jgi:putative membrane protein
MSRFPTSPAVLAIAVGGAAAVALVAWAGAGAIGDAVLRAGWAVPATVVLHVLQLWLSAIAWRGLCGGGPPTLTAWWRIRWVRESVNSLLPVAQLGGNLVGIRLLAHRGLPIPRAAAGTTLDLTVEALTQLLFTLAGIGVLATLGGEQAWRPWLGGGLLAMGIGVAGFVVAQRAGLMQLIEWLADKLRRVLPAVAPDALHGLHDELMRRQRDRPALLRATALHLTAWLLGVAETWLVLAAMGRPTGLAVALAIESLGMAARSAGFVVPGALGVQEGGFVLAGSLFGLPADAAVALSMVKRARELAVGVPGLLAWQWAEGSRLARRPSV